MCSTYFMLLMFARMFSGIFLSFFRNPFFAILRQVHLLFSFPNFTQFSFFFYTFTSCIPVSFSLSFCPFITVPEWHYSIPVSYYFLFPSTDLPLSILISFFLHNLFPPSLCLSFVKFSLYFCFSYILSTSPPPQLHSLHPP